VNDAFAGDGPKLKIGAYASGYVCGTLQQLELIDYCWITCSLGFRGSRVAVEGGNYDIWQQHCERKFLNRDADYNIARISDWGQYIPFRSGVPSPTPAEVAEAAPSYVALASLMPSVETPQVYRGIASWYADDSNASGMPVNNATDMTAASWKFPLGLRVKVTRVATGQSVVVTIQDRGPAKHLGRLIDLRPRPARELNLIEAGIGEVTVEEC
jgi:rare lipoprotein A (peptidoglycan hydrolase)